MAPAHLKWISKTVAAEDKRRTQQPAEIATTKLQKKVILTHKCSLFPFMSSHSVSFSLT